MLVWGILNIVLFFKIWGMTNDVSAIRDYLLEEKNSVIHHSIPDNMQDEYKQDVTETASIKHEDLKPGDRVQHEQYSRDKNLYIGKINGDGTCLCVDDKGNAIGTYSLGKLAKI